jgi:hypothetical protein
VRVYYNQRELPDYTTIIKNELGIKLKQETLDTILIPVFDKNRPPS